MTQGFATRIIKRNIKRLVGTNLWGGFKKGTAPQVFAAVNNFAENAIYYRLILTMLTMGQNARKLVTSKAVGITITPIC